MIHFLFLRYAYSSRRYAYELLLASIHTYEFAQHLGCMHSFFGLDRWKRADVLNSDPFPGT